MFHLIQAETVGYETRNKVIKLFKKWKKMKINTFNHCQSFYLYFHHFSHVISSERRDQDSDFHSYSFNNNLWNIYDFVIHFST